MLSAEGGRRFAVIAVPEKSTRLFMTTTRHALAIGFVGICSQLLFSDGAQGQNSTAGKARMHVWHRDLNKAANLARQTSKPLFVVFRCER